MLTAWCNWPVIRSRGNMEQAGLGSAVWMPRNSWMCSWNYDSALRCIWHLHYIPILWIFFSLHSRYWRRERRDRDIIVTKNMCQPRYVHVQLLESIKTKFIGISQRMCQKKKKKRETCEIFGCPSSEKISNSKTPALRQPKLTVFVWLIRWIINKCRHKHNTSKYCTHQYTQEKLFHGVNNTVLIWILYLIFRSSGLECTLWCPFDLPFVSGDILQMSVCSLLYK